MTWLFRILDLKSKSSSIKNCCRGSERVIRIINEWEVRTQLWRYTHYIFWATLSFSKFNSCFISSASIKFSLFKGYTWIILWGLRSFLLIILWDRIILWDLATFQLLTFSLGDCESSDFTDQIYHLQLLNPIT